MPQQLNFEPDTLMDEVMRAKPATISVLIRDKIHCVGCVLACFHSVDYAAREHGKDCDALLAALNAVRAQHTG